MIGLLLAFGCATKDDGTTDGDAGGGSGGGGGDDTCGEPTAEAQTPQDGVSDVYYRTTVEFNFTKDTDEDATVTLEDSAGTAVDGATSWLGDTIVFTPAGPLATTTDYKATLSHCGGSDSISFRTSDLGASLEDGAASLVGNTYAVALSDARFVKPEGVGALLGSLLTQDILIGVTDATETDISMMGALSQEGSSSQDMCTATFDFPIAADFSSAPYFSVSASELAIAISGFSISINDFVLSGDFSASGDMMGGAVLMGQIDARDLTGVLVDSELITDDDPQAVCDMISAFGVNCEECADGMEYCLTIHVDQINAAETGETLTPLAEEDIADDCE